MNSLIKSIPIIRQTTKYIPFQVKIKRPNSIIAKYHADYIIVDGLGGGTGAAPLIFRDHISVPTIPALARARRYLDKKGASGRVTLIITGGFRTAPDFTKSLSLGADGIALSTSAMQAIGCVGARISNTNNCPAGIATQKTELRKKLDVDLAAARLGQFFNSSTQLMKVMGRACGHSSFKEFYKNDISTFDPILEKIAGINYSGFKSD